MCGISACGDGARNERIRIHLPVIYTFTFIIYQISVICALFILLYTWPLLNCPTCNLPACCCCRVGMCTPAPPLLGPWPWVEGGGIDIHNTSIHYTHTAHKTRLITNSKHADDTDAGIDARIHSKIEDSRRPQASAKAGTSVPLSLSLQFNSLHIPLPFLCQPPLQRPPQTPLQPPTAVLSCMLDLKYRYLHV
jgi:hypothetical protein